MPYAVIRVYIGNFALLDIKIFLQLDRVLHIPAVGAAIDLRTQRMHRRALAEVQHTALQRIFIRSLTHFAAERINLPYKVTLCRAAY